MVLHDHQANPHVHISVRAESRHGSRLNPRKADLHRWRETFAEKLRGWGVDAEATRQSTRGQLRNYEPLWRLKAGEDGRLRSTRSAVKDSRRSIATRRDAAEAWSRIAHALETSGDAADQKLAREIKVFLGTMPAKVQRDFADGGHAERGMSARPEPGR